MLYTKIKSSFKIIVIQNPYNLPITSYAHYKYDHNDWQYYSLFHIIEKLVAKKRNFLSHNFK